MTSSSRTAVLFSIAVCALACSKSEPATSTQASSTVASSTVSTIAAPPPAAPAPAPAPATITAATATPPAAATQGAIATADGENPGLRVDVTELKRSSGGTVMLKFTVANSRQMAVSFSSHFLGDTAFGDTDYRAVGAVHLIDPVGKKKYFVMRDAERKCICSREVGAVEPGEKMNLWAKFPAPPPDVQKVTIVVPHFTPMDDVPIQ